ncbi:MAG: SDR family NAD(P)-dependent oxidoreductase [Acidobacteriota bacterium]
MSPDARDASRPLAGKTALVTGGSEGIGFAIAEALVAEGVEVGINGRSRERLEDAGRRLDVATFQGDIGDEDTARTLVSDFVDRFGRLDILINNAGFGYFSPLVEMELERFLDVQRTNVTGAFLMGREAARRFVDQGGGGDLINISSTAGTKGFQGGTAYATSKFALRGMTECWRDELRRHDVRVMLVNPSEVQTRFAGKAGLGQQKSEKKLRGQEIADAIIGILKLDRRGFVPELAVFATNPF